MRKYLIILLVIIWAVALFAHDQTKNVSLDEILLLLKTRKDKEALEISEMILLEEPGNLDALWVKAEVLRRMREDQDAEQILNKILKKNPDHLSSLISLSYLRYKNDKLTTAQELIRQVLKTRQLDKENKAMAYLIQGAINSRLSTKGKFFNKIIYGAQIKGFFLKAKETAPELAEVHLGLGTFYLLAPKVAGGNLKEALRELQIAVAIAPDFATANARLAQAFKKEGNLRDYIFYLERARKLDPENEVLREAALTN